MTWSFDHRTRLVFGRGARQRIARFAGEFGRRPLLITGRRSLDRGGELAALRQHLEDHQLVYRHLVVDSEPDCRLVDALVTAAADFAPDMVIAVGGGSVIDAGKAAAALITGGGRCVDYLEGLPGVDAAKPVTAAPLPVVACPTTAGTGSEVTRNAVIQAEDFGLKRSMRSSQLVPRVAVIDPAYLDTCPHQVAAASGFDALSHLVEAWCSTAATPMTDALAWPGMERALMFLRELAAGTPHQAAIDGMAMAATWGGICLANARLGAAHGLVAPLGGRFSIGHGAGMAALLGPTLIANHRALVARGPEGPGLIKLGRLAALITGRKEAGIVQAAHELVDLRLHLDLSGLAAAGVTDADLAALAAAPSGSIKTNPVALDTDELVAILRAAL